MGRTKIFGRWDETSSVQIQTPIDGICPKCRAEGALVLRVKQWQEEEDSGGWPIYDLIETEDAAAYIGCTKCYKLMLSPAGYAKGIQR